MSGELLWRGGLPPLGCEAAPKPANPLCQIKYEHWIYDCFAAERGQAPSPQSASHQAIVIRRLSSLGCSFAL